AGAPGPSRAPRAGERRPGSASGERDRRDPQRDVRAGRGEPHRGSAGQTSAIARQSGGVGGARRPHQRVGLSAMSEDRERSEGAASRRPGFSTRAIHEADSPAGGTADQPVPPPIWLPPAPPSNVV